VGPKKQKANWEPIKIVEEGDPEGKPSRRHMNSTTENLAEETSETLELRGQEETGEKAALILGEVPFATDRGLWKSPKAPSR
jgi:hypothetical protein